MLREPKLPILLVEDNPDHAALAKNAILKSKADAYAIDIAGSVEEAMELITAGHYSLVISDYNLPGKTGLELLQWMNQQNNDLPFVMMTGAGDEKTAVSAMRSGAYNYLVKDDVYLSVIPHVVDETLLKHFAEGERKRFESEIREKNVALEKANRELKKLDQLKSDFISSVSHDIRSPINSVQESIALILDGIVNTNEEKGKSVLQIAKRSIERLSKMINDLLDFSKLEGGKLRLHIDSADIQILVDESLASLKSLADRKKIKLEFKHTADFPKVPCDAERLIQVFINLIGNAIKFTPECGTITVETKVDNARALISFRDTGIGIKKEHLSRIFERFEQVDGADSGGVKGTGLGLAICKEFIKLHDGDIWVESELGKGSKFIVVLPLKQQARQIEIPSEVQGAKKAA